MNILYVACIMLDFHYMLWCYAPVKSTSYNFLLQIGALSTLGRDGEFHVFPTVVYEYFHPLAFKEVPSSLSNMYVIILSYPNAFAALLQAPYRKLQVFFVPSVHNRITSTVFRWSIALATGRPTIATPHSLSLS